MKNRIIYIVAVWLLGTISAFAENSLYADDISMTAGDTVDLKIKMKNDVNVAGLSFTLTLPEGLSLVLDKEKSLVYTLNPDRAKSTKFSVFSATKGKGVYGVRVMPTSTSVIQESDGWILSFKLHADAKLKDGTNQVNLTESSFTVKGGNNSLRTETLKEMSFTVSVTEKDHDVKKNNYIYADDINMIAGKTVALDVKMKNELIVAGLSFTMKLPTGLSLEVDNEGDLVYSLNEDRAMSTKFSVMSAVKDDEVGIRIIPTTTTNIKGSDGRILSFQLHSDAKMTEGTYSIRLTDNRITVKDENNTLSTGNLNDTIINVKVKVVEEVEGAIRFADNNVKAICVANWDTNADEELTEEEAAKVSTIGGVFKGNTEITSFQELSYFKALDAIEKNAFSGCTSLKSITLPESMTKIGDAAFNGCTSLASLSIPNDVVSIGSNAFAGCSELTSVELPASLTKIVENTFKGCTSLASIAIPQSVTYIGKDALSGCISLASIDIPSSITFVGEGAFDKTAWYNNLPDGVVYVGKEVYKYKGTMPANTNIQLKEGIIGFTDKAFAGCTGLNSITIPEGVMSIGISVFDGCTGLTSIQMPNSLVSIGNEAFFDCKNLLAIVIPNGVKTIGEYAFYYCTCLTSVEIGSSVSGIADRAFLGCSSLSSVVSQISNPFTFGTYSFDEISDNCILTVPYGTREKYITKGWTEEVFKGGVVELEPISVIEFADANVKDICVANWDTNGDGLFSEEEAAAVKDIGEVFKGNKEITSFDELQYFTGLTTIGTGTFESCNKLTSVIIPRNVTSIGVGAFANCVGLTSISVAEGNGVYDSRNNCNAIIETQSNKLISGCKCTIIPDKVTAIGDYAFAGSSLTAIDIPNSVTTIGQYAFSGSNITTITIPESVTTIGNRAFNSCGSLTEVYCYTTNVPEISNDVFGEVDLSSVTLHVPERLLEGYKEKAPWKDFGKLDAIPEEVPEVLITFVDDNVKSLCVAKWDTNGDKELSEKEAAAVTNLGSVFSGNTKITSFEELKYFTGLSIIDKNTFSGCTSLGAIDLPKTISKIGDSAFKGCSALTSITIPEGVTSIGSNVFYDCTGLTSIELPESLTKITDSAFKYCSNLTSISIPDAVETIGVSTFYGCTGLTSIKLPKSLKKISDSVFRGCFDLTSIVIPNGVKAIETKAFRDCSSLNSIIIPSSVTSIEDDAFSGCINLSSVVSEIKKPFAFGTDAFANISASCKLTVPSGTRSAYLSAGWTKDVFKGGIYEVGEVIKAILFADAKVKEICVASWDTNGDGLFSEEEAAAVKDIGEVFKGNKEITSFDELQYFTGLTTIGTGTFESCNKLTSVIIPRNVTSIGVGAFANCVGLTSISVAEGNGVYDSRNNCNAIIETQSNKLISGCKYTIIPDNVTAIGDYAFESCTGLVSVEIPNSVKEVGNGSFAGCAGLTTISIGSGVESIGIQAFANCVKLADVYCYADKAPNTQSDAFNGLDIESATLHVSESALISYQNAQPWSNFPKIVKILQEFILTFIVDGEIYRTYKVEVGTSIIPPYTPIKEGHICEWVDLPEMMPAHDVTVIGTFFINKYKITYVVDGEEYKSTEIEFGKAITPESEPNKDSYKFSGWSEIPQTMPSHDVVITGSFTRFFKLIHVVNLVNFIMNANASTDDTAFYDMNGDMDLDIGDVILIVKNILDNGGSMESPELRRASGIVDFAQYTAAQFDIVVDKNASIKDIRLVGSMKQSHQLMYQQKDENTYSVVVFSMSSRLMSPERGNIVEIETTSGNAILQSLIVATPSGESYSYLNGGLPTEINSMTNNKRPNEIYDLKGYRLNESDMKKGVYIINGKKVVVK